MECIEIICLYLKNYISDKQFESIFYQNIDAFETELETGVYWSILSSNFNKKENLIDMKICLYNYILKKYKLVYDEINDIYVENLVKNNIYTANRNIVMDILEDNYKQKEEVLIDCHEINTELELINLIKKIFNFPSQCGNNWDAFNDFICDIILPKKIIFYNWSSIEEKLPLAATNLKRILNKINQAYCTILYI